MMPVELRFVSREAPKVKTCVTLMVSVREPIAEVSNGRSPMKMPLMAIVAITAARV